MLRVLDVHTAHTQLEICQDGLFSVDCTHWNDISQDLQNYIDALGTSALSYDDAQTLFEMLLDDLAPNINSFTIAMNSDDVILNSGEQLQVKRSVIVPKDFPWTPQCNPEASVNWSTVRWVLDP